MRKRSGPACIQCGASLGQDADACRKCGAPVERLDLGSALAPPSPVALPHTLDAPRDRAAVIDTGHLEPSSTPSRRRTASFAVVKKDGVPVAPKPIQLPAPREPMRNLATTKPQQAPRPAALPKPATAAPQEITLEAALPAPRAAELPPTLLPPPRDGNGKGQVQVPVELAPGPVVRPGAVECCTSLTRGSPPDPGIQAAPYNWLDLLDGEPPPLPKAGEGGYSVYHAIDVDADVRITYHTVVSVRNVRQREGAEDKHRIVADGRVAVQKRALLEVMDAARARADQSARKSREALARRMARRRAKVLRWPRWAAPLGFGLLRAQANMGLASIQATRRMRRNLVEIPDALFSSLLRVDYHVSDRLARRSLVAGLKDPATLTQEQRSVALFLTVVGVAFTVLLLNSFFALAFSGNAPVYRQMLTDAAIQFVGLLGAPIPIEIVLIGSMAAIGPVLAFTGLFVGKMVGAWVLYLLGDSMKHHLEKKTQGKRGKRMMAWLNKNVAKHGMLLLILDNAVPFAPDQLMLVFAVSGIRFRTWMVGIVIGTAIKYGVVIGGVMLIGPERIAHFFENPLG